MAALLRRPAVASRMAVPCKMGLIEYSRVSCDMNISEQLLHAGSGSRKKCRKICCWPSKELPTYVQVWERRPLLVLGSRSLWAGGEESNYLLSVSLLTFTILSRGQILQLGQAECRLCREPLPDIFFTHDLMARVCAHRPRNVHHAPACTQCSPTAEGAPWPALLPKHMLPLGVLHPILREVG